MSETGNQAAAEAPGAALAAARQAQNLSVADVAHQLKLSVSQIEALEAGAFTKLPGPIFVRGFIRNYARLLKLDPEALLRSIEPGMPSSSPTAEAPPSQDIPFPPAETRRWPWYAMAVLLLIGVLAAYEFYWNEPEFAVVKTPPAAEVVAVSPTAAVPVASSPVATASEPAPTMSGPTEAGSTASAASTLTQGAKTADKTVAALQPVTAAASDDDRLPQPGERPLQFVFDRESWVEIRDGSGKIIFSQLNQSGSKRRVYGKPPLSVIVGNAHGVRLTYNNAPVDLERHTKVDVARFTLE